MIHEDLIGFLINPYSKNKREKNDDKVRSRKLWENPNDPITIIRQNQNPKHSLDNRTQHTQT